jgi:HAD superfamily hydrolase (TIGR01662 family)
MAVSTVIFDLGGTLVRESSSKPEESRRFLLSRVVQPRGLREEDLQEFDEQVFPDMLERRERSGLDFQLAQYLNLVQACLNIRLQGNLDEIGYECWIRQHVPQLEEGAKECLAKLRRKGVKLGLLSNTILSSDSIKLALRTFGILEGLDTVVCSSEVGYRKPNRLIFQSAIRRLESEPEECVMVGDDLKADIAGAAACGMKTVWYNPGDSSGLEIKPDYVISSLRWLPGVLGL